MLDGGEGSQMYGLSRGPVKVLGPKNIQCVWGDGVTYHQGLHGIASVRGLYRPPHGQ